jgi:hypothetical protein
LKECQSQADIIHSKPYEHISYLMAGGRDKEALVIYFQSFKIVNTEIIKLTSRTIVYVEYIDEQIHYKMVKEDWSDSLKDIYSIISENFIKD